MVLSYFEDWKVNCPALKLLLTDGDLTLNFFISEDCFSDIFKVFKTGAFLIGLTGLVGPFAT